MVPLRSALQRVGGLVAGGATVGEREDTVSQAGP